MYETQQPSAEIPLFSMPNYYDGVIIPCVVIASLLFFVLLILIIEIAIAATNSSIAKKHPELPPPKNGFLKRFIIYLVVAVIALYIAQAIDCLTNKANKDGWINPFTRTARTNNVFVDQSIEFNLSDNYTVKPYYDIKNLEITVFFYDKGNNLISNKTKTVGDIKANTVNNFSFALNEFSASEILKITKWNAEVTGGTISYFATFSKLLSEMN